LFCANAGDANSSIAIASLFIASSKNFLVISQVNRPKDGWFRCWRKAPHGARSNPAQKASGR
jgi:hypothetical protein